MAEQVSHGDKLKDILGFDPTKKGPFDSTVLKEIVDELAAERAKEAKQRAKELLTKAIGLREQMVKAQKEFDAQSRKFDKELGNILRQIQNPGCGEAAPEEKPAPELVGEG